MDATDLAILREMFSDRVLRLGGADPRISAAEIAARLGLPTSTVTQRRRNWRREGLVNGWIVFPNPRLFEMEVFGQIVVPSSASARAAVADALPTLPNAAHGWEPDSEPVLAGVWIGYVDRTPDSAERGAEILRRIPGLKVELTQHLFPMPECSVRPTQLDWRIIRAIRRTPEKPLGEVARELHVGFRTLARRFDRLLTEGALLFVPRLDFSRTAGTTAEVSLTIDPGTDVGELWNRIEREHPVVLPHAPWRSPTRVWDLVPGNPRYGPRVFYLVCLDSPAQGPTVIRTVERWPGVSEVNLNFLVKVWYAPQRYDELVEQRLEPSLRPPPRG